MWCCLPCPSCPLLLDINEEILAPPSAVLLSQDSLCWEILMLVLSSVAQHCSPQITGQQPDPWLVPSFPGVMSSGVNGLDQGILSQNIGEDKACSMCARWEILLMTLHYNIIHYLQYSPVALCWHCVFRGVACVPMLITVAKWSTASEILFPGIPSSTQRKITPSRNRPTKICSWLRLVSGCSDSWHCKSQ